MTQPRECIRVIWSEAESSGDITRAIGEALAPYPPDAVLHVSHSVAHKPESSIMQGAGDTRMIYTALILVREPVAPREPALAR